MGDAARTRYSFADYVDLERYSNVRHEYFAGVIYAMAGGSREHAAMAARIIARLAPQLTGKRCEAHTSDLRIRASATGLATYPDVTVLCGPIETDPEDPHTITNPKVVFEVLSDSTEDYDRGEKLDHYQQIPSLQEIVLVSQRAPLIEVWRREQTKSWSRHTFGPHDIAQLLSLQAELPVDDLYADPLASPPSSI